MKYSIKRILCGALLATLLCPMLLSGCSGEMIQGLFGKSSLIISEVCSSNSSALVDEDFGSPDWIELYNSGSKAIDLKNYALSNDPKNPTKYMFPEITIEPGQYLIVYATKLESPDPITKPATGFKLASGGMTLYLTASGGDTLYKLEIPKLARDTAYSLGSDGEYHVNGNPTPGAANVIVDSAGGVVAEMDEASAPLIITEYMVHNGYSIKDSDGDRSAWVELTNNGTQTVSLLQYRLSDNIEKTAKWAFPDVTVQPGERIIVFCSGKDKTTETGELHTNFKLSGSDTHLILMDMENMQQQAISLPIMKDNISCGLQNGQWLFFAQPTPGKENNTKGFTLMSDFSGAFDPNGLYVSEVCTVSSYGSTALDWIELHNGSNATVNLNGYFLSDSLDEPTRTVIGNVSIPAGGYTVISTSNNVRKQTGGVLSMGLDAAGENIVLSSPEGAILDVFATGALRPGVTSGRITGDASGERVFFTSETKGRANPTSGYKGYVAQPQYSVPGGVQSGNRVSVEIDCDTEGAKIYYTTDGSAPTTSGHLYSGPVTASSSMSLRAIAVKDGLLNSDPQIATYLFTKPHSVPVVCLSMAPSEFSTMYANTLTYRTIERPGVVEYYDTDGSLGVSFGASVRVSGWSSRSFNQKSLTFKMDEAFGKDCITYPFFEGYDTETFYSMTMRAGGQDRWKAYIRDAFLSKLVATSDVIDGDAPMTRFAVLYVNGKYWGLYDLREEINKDMLATHHEGVDVHTVNYLRRAVAQYGSLDGWRKIIDYSRNNDLGNSEKYAQYCQWVDAHAWADYLVLRNYFRETDMFNQKYWHTDGFGVKMRPIYFDNDYSLYDSAALTTNLIGTYFSHGGYTTKNGTYVSMDITAGLWESKEFQNLFKERWILLSNTEFQPDKLVKMLDSMVAEMEPEMARQISRWGAPSSMSKWKSSIDEFRSLLKKRPTSAKALIQKYFTLTAEELAQYK